MLIDARELSGENTLRAGICVVGAGAAGISLARALEGTGIDVLLLESGLVEPDETTQDLNVAENAGEPYWPLDDNRLRALGGTTGKWAGWCRPLDEIDLEARAWVPMSGWPLRREELAPWWERAQEVCQLGPFDYDLASWERRLGAPRLPLGEGEVESKIYQLSPPTRFGTVYRDELGAAREVTVVTGATAMGLDMSADGTAVEGVRAGCLTGTRLTVQARAVVLATGGVENARLLLLSGLGERRELVGRCFMEHPHFPAGRVVLERPLSTALYRPRRGVIAVARLFLPREVQEREGLLHSNIMLDPDSPPWMPPLAAAALRRLSPRPPRTFQMAHTLEQAPDRESRVELSGERDALGLPRARLRWRTGDAERRTFERGQQLLGEALARAGAGRVEPAELGDGWPILQGRLGHHMGTTRMDPDPRHGVVDTDARVHGVRNLFLAGSSVFPTGGAGTPTYTIVALALRLADHLAGRAREGGW